MMFYVAAFAMLGALDKYTKDDMRAWRGADSGIDGSASKLRAWTIIIMYGLSALITAIGENVELRLYYAESRVAGWYHATDGELTLRCASCQGTHSHNGAACARPPACPPAWATDHRDAVNAATTSNRCSRRGVP
jgi:hypothetical protein